MTVGQSRPATKTEKIELMEKILEAQIGLNKHLLETARQKQRLIIQGNLPELNQLLQTEGLLIGEAVKLEAERFGLQSELAQEHGLPSQELTLARIKEIFGQATAHLQQLGTELYQVLDELNLVNQQNATLIEQSLQFLEYNMNLLTGIGNDQGVYGQSGAECAEPQVNRAWIFDKKA
jgi:small-conductance mechanosensitive channel